MTMILLKKAKEMTCPYCGAVSPYKHEDVEMAINLPGTTIKVNCWECGKLFRVSWEIKYKVMFTSEGD